MSDLEIIGRAAGSEHFSSPASRSRVPLSRKEELSLCEAAVLANITIEDLKQAIRSGELRAGRRGWWRIRSGDLHDYLRGR